MYRVRMKAEMAIRNTSSPPALAQVGMRSSHAGSRSSFTRGIPRGGAVTVVAISGRSGYPAAFVDPKRARARHQLVMRRRPAAQERQQVRVALGADLHDDVRGRARMVDVRGRRLDRERV